jgi:multimeric flavodoxin WrbA
MVERKSPLKAVLLDGSVANDHTGERVRAALTAQLQAQGWDVEHVRLRECNIGNCGGEFFCWIKHPGTCMLDDDNRVIARALANSDLTVYLTPVTFGGYSSTLPGIVDHQIQNISPLFAKIEGETHHRKRYKENPDLLAIGWMDAPDAQSEAVFRHLVWRNAINWHAKTWVSDVVLANQSDDELQASARRWVDDIRARRSSPQVELPLDGHPPSAASTTSARRPETGTGHGPIEVRRALLLVGSPKTRKSTSDSLGGYLFEQLEARSIHTETIYLHAALRFPEKAQALLDAVDAADLVVLAFPLYVDALPAPATEALERIAAHRQGRDPAHRQERDPGHRQLFAAIANCGFPEAFQAAAALAICEAFARQAGFEWAGSLALGGGGIVGGVPLAEGGGKTALLRQSLELAAGALAQCRVIPQAAQDIMAKPVIPFWVYGVMSSIGWRQQAKRYGAQRSLKRQPYAAKAK